MTALDDRAVALVMPPQPEIVCRVTSASPSALPPTTRRPWSTIMRGVASLIAASRSKCR
jgi:hypothetical protein